MNSKATVLMSVFAAALVLTPVLSEAHTITEADITYTPNVKINEARLETTPKIPTDGSHGAFGFGILTATGDSIIVTTTHQGVHDSEDQNNGDAKWHNHYVQLISASSDCTNADPNAVFEVAQITYESPGEISILNGVSEGRATMEDLPASFSGHSSFAPTGPLINMNPGTDINNVVSFKLVPIGSDIDGSGILEAHVAGEIEHVCVTDVENAQSMNTWINFFVLPEASLGAVAVLASIFAAFIGYNYMRRK